MQKNTKQTQDKRQYITYAIYMSLVILLLAVFSIAWILFPAPSEGKIADIYQNGILLESIPLDSAKEPFSFTVMGDNGCFNEITVKDGSIGISSASCPDKLCVHQGYIHSSRLPITCLPNRLVIQVREKDELKNSGNDLITPDIIAY